MRPQSSGKTPGNRGNALWGSGRSGNDTRASALWGKGGRGFVALFALAIALSVPVASTASHAATSTAKNGNGNNGAALVPSELLAAAQANPQQIFHVIVQGTGHGNSDKLAQNVADWAAHSEKQLQDAASQADAAAQSAQANAATLAGQASQAQQNANAAQANAAAKAVKAKLNGKKADQAAAAQAAQAAAAQAQASAQAQQNAQSAQNAVGQAQAAVASAQSAFGDEANAIVKNHLKDAFHSISGDAMTLTGEQIVGLASHGKDGILSITPDVPVASQDVPDSTMWPASADVAPLWNTTDPNTGAVLGPAPQAPAIAIVDSGIDASKTADFGSRVVASVDLSTLDPNATGDQEGHGTMVAGIAAGASADYPGAAQNAPLVDVHTADANGESLTSDVIAAADWILANKDQYNIKVANFSMVGSTPTTFQFDPLDQAVESLWFNGVVVVAAAGNEGTGSPVDMSGAPGNDPFVITVGALDQQATSDPSDDTIAPWSAYGYTADGFSKPDIAAPGRYMVAPTPMDGTIATTVPDRIVAPGYIWMSGTSFAAPVVSGAAAQILAVHPDWTPDEVKGALMLTAAYLPNVDPQAAGVGEVDAATAASLDFTPPNPNENLDTFITNDPTTGAPVFDAASWSSAVQSDASWSSAAWSSAAWSSAAWSSAAWSSAAWSSSDFTASTDSAMQSLASWSSASWSSAAWASASWNSSTLSASTLAK